MSRHRESIAGKVFGRLTALSPVAGSDKWLCECACGVTKSIAKPSLVKGSTQSCGCILREMMRARRKHPVGHRYYEATIYGPSDGRSGHPSYPIWGGMMQRCFNPKNKSWKDYGGRGIRVCDRWLLASAFCEDMGPPPLGMSIDRIDVNGDYEPGNCRWATPTEQCNNKRNNFLIEYGGKTRTLRDAARLFNMHGDTLRSRVVARGGPAVIERLLFCNPGIVW
jgi:hypothetical protein